MAGIEEILEKLDALNEATGYVVEIMEDGKVSLGDLPTVWKLVGLLGEVAQDYEKLKEELKDVDAAEFQRIITKLIDVVYGLIAAVSKLLGNK